jgi:hypothetical protein
MFLYADRYLLQNQRADMILTYKPRVSRSPETFTNNVMIEYNSALPFDSVAKCH